MADRRNSLDGFVPRRPGGLDRADRQMGQHADEIPSRFMRIEKEDAAAEQPTVTRSELGVPRGDISSSLSGLDEIDAPNPKKGKGKGKRHGKNKKPVSKKRRIIKWTIIVILLALLGYAGFMAYKVLNAGGSIFKGSILDIIESQPLKQDANGRSNILVLGTSEDDPGHPGGHLTDSMMLMSIDQNKKLVDMFSIPRDLYVKYGMACASGYEGKINEYFSCVNDGNWSSASAEDQRLTATRKFIGNILGVDIQYAVHVDNTVIKQAVDAVGGVDVNIQGDGPVPYGVAPGSILDRNFDWRCNYQCYLVKYSPGIHHLDGEHALYLAEARGDTAPTYGLVRSNFDREANQQKIIIALKEKAVSTGTLANPAKVTSLIDALGNNLHTNFETKEIRTLMNLASSIKSNNIRQLDDSSVTQPANFGGSSVVIPTSGVFDYTSIQDYLKKELSSNDVTREGANVVVLNGSGVAGVAQTQADKLTSEGFNITTVDTAPAGNYDNVDIYQIGSGMDQTRAKLESQFGVKVKTTTPPVSVADGTNFVIIFGKDPSASSSSSN